MLLRAQEVILPNNPDNVRRKWLPSLNNPISKWHRSTWYFREADESSMETRKESFDREPDSDCVRAGKRTNKKSYKVTPLKGRVMSA